MSIQNCARANKVKEGTLNDWLREGLEDDGNPRLQEFAALFYQATTVPFVKAGNVLNALLESDNEIRNKDGVLLSMKWPAVGDPALSPEGYMEWIKNEIFEQLSQQDPDDKEIV